MNIENQHNDFLTFKKYYTGKMSPEEKSDFETNLKNDPFAQEAFAGFLELETDFKRISAIEHFNITFKEKQQIPEGSSFFSIKPLLGVAASILIFIGSYTLIQNNFNKTDYTLAKNKNVELGEIEEASIESNTTNYEDVIISDSLLNSIYNLDESISIDDNGNDIIVTAVTKKEEDFGSKKNKKTSQVVFVSEQEAETPLDEIDDITKSEAKLNSDIEEVAEVSQTSASTYSNENKDISTTIISMSNYKSGLVAYNTSDYTKSIKYFNLSLNESKSINSSNYYIGMSYFNQNKSNKAIKYYDLVIKTSSSLADDAQWYKAMSLINKGQKDKAKTILTVISKSKSAFKDSAHKKLKSL